MRLCGILLVILCMTASAEDGQRTGPRNRAPQVRSVGDQASRRYVEAVVPVLERIAASYQFEAIPLNRLAGQALLGLYSAGKLTPPPDLVRDPDHYITTFPGSSLRDQLAEARKAVPEAAGLRFDSDVHASLKAVFAKLDVHSSYYPVRLEVRRAADRGSALGVYLEDRPLGESFFVRSIEFNSSAQAAGLRPGDEVLEVDSAPVVPGTPTAQVQIEIYQKFQRNSGVSLFVRHVNGEKQLVKLRRAERALSPLNEALISVNEDPATPILGFRRRDDNEWDHWVDRPNRIALIRLGTVTYGVHEFIQLIAALQEDGLKGLILDLRDCPSGYPDSAAEMTGIFLDNNALIASNDYRNNAERRNSAKEFRARNTEQKTFLDFPLLVLVGPDTSGAAELIAAALQDHKRAKIVGQRSRGKATIQAWEETSRGGNDGANHSYKLTTGIFTRPSGKALHRQPGTSVQDDWGVRPDIDVVLTAQLRRQIRAWWFEHDLLPPNSTNPTSLDDPRNDPVLDTALRSLRKQLNPQ